VNTLRFYINFLSDAFTGEGWHEIKHKELMQWWHFEAIKSSTFIVSTLYDENLLFSNTSNNKKII
jgi:hypothetical protein